MNRLSEIALSKVAGTATVLFLLFAGTAQNVASSTPDSGQHFPTCEQIEILPDGISDMSATSPDGKYTVCVKEDREDKEQFRTSTSVYLSHGGRLRTLGRYKDVTESAVLLWAPDSRAFAWNFTYGGATSGWTTMVFNFRSGRFREIDRIVSRDFHRRLRKACKEDETDDNSYLLRWTGSRSILIAVEAHPGGLDCRRPAPTEFYQVGLPSGRIIKYFQGAEREAVIKEFPNDGFR